MWWFDCHSCFTHTHTHTHTTLWLLIYPHSPLLASLIFCLSLQSAHRPSNPAHPTLCTFGWLPSPSPRLCSQTSEPGLYKRINKWNMNSMTRFHSRAFQTRLCSHPTTCDILLGVWRPSACVLATQALRLPRLTWGSSCHRALMSSPCPLTSTSPWSQRLREFSPQWCYYCQKKQGARHWHLLWQVWYLR